MITVAALVVPVAVATGADHQVQPGETLYGIARRNDTSVSVLAETNGIPDPARIYAGQIIRIPDAPQAAVTPPAAPPAAVQPSPAPQTAPDGLEAVFDRMAAVYDVDPVLLKAVCWVESGWQADAVSSAGALGICQVLPSTAAWASGLIGRPLDPLVPEHGIELAAWYIRWLIGQVGADLAVPSYYQGPGAVLRGGVSAGGRAYGDRVYVAKGRFG